MSLLSRAEDRVRRVLAELARRGETLASCESLTGGLVGATITGVPGASAVYRGGLITYATELKAELAGVARQTLDRHGAVADETARQMAIGTARVCGSDWGLATTGVAGPDPQEGHPPGTVFVAVARRVTAGPGDTDTEPGADTGVDPGADTGVEVVAERLGLAGSRNEIRRAAVEALFVLFEARLTGSATR